MNAKKKKTPASSSQDTEKPKPRPKTKPALLTVGDLYRAIDWSKAPAADPDDLDFVRRFRLVLIDEALLGSGEHRAAARAMLNAIGVWPQIVKYLTNR